MSHPALSIMLHKPMISTVSGESMGIAMKAHVGSGTFASAVWPTSNRAYYYPFRIDHPITVLKLWMANGAAAAGNLDIGIYSEDGTRIVSSGSTAQAGTNTLQEIDIADTVIGPGAFYLAAAMDGTTGTAFRFSGGSSTRSLLLGYYSQVTAFPLPANATFASQASQWIPLFGLAAKTIV